MLCNNPKYSNHVIINGKLLKPAKSSMSAEMEETRKMLIIYSKDLWSETSCLM